MNCSNYSQLDFEMTIKLLILKLKKEVNFNCKSTYWNTSYCNILDILHF